MGSPGSRLRGSSQSRARIKPVCGIHLAIGLILAAALAGCAPPAELTSPPTPVDTASPTAPPPLTPTAVSSQVPPPAEPDSSPSPTARSTQVTPAALPPLGDLLLTWEDVHAWEAASGDFSYIRMIFGDLEHDISDRSAELDNRCRIECTKEEWVTVPHQSIGLDGEEYTYLRQAFIITMRSEDPAGARLTAGSLFEEFSASYDTILDQEDFQPYFTYLLAPQENTRIGQADDLYGMPGYHVILTTSRGPIALLVISYIPPWSDDLSTELLLAVEFANARLYQLERAGLLLPMERD